MNGWADEWHIRCPGCSAWPGRHVTGQAPPRTVAHVGVEAQRRQHGDGDPGCGRREVMKRGLGTSCSGRLQGSWRPAACTMMRAGAGGAGPEDRAWRPGGEPPRVRKRSGGWRREDGKWEPRGGSLRARAQMHQCVGRWRHRRPRGGGRGAGARVTGVQGARLCAALAPGLCGRPGAGSWPPAVPRHFPPQGRGDEEPRLAPGAVAWPCCLMGRSLASLGWPDPDPCR